eukprot:4314163-Amphidinium_carterae.1
MLHLVGKSLQLVPSSCVPCQLTVTVVWGVRPPQSSPLINLPDPMFSYDSTFQLSNPWAQRAIYQMCTEALNAKTLLRATNPKDSVHSWMI